MNPETRSRRPQVRDDLAELTGYHSPQLSVAVRLNTNESPIGPPAEFVDDVVEVVRSVEWHRYPDRAASRLRDAIGGLHGVGREQVLAANGSNEVLQLLLLAFGGPGRRAATFEPTYALHSHIARLTGTERVVGERSSQFALEPAEVDRVLATEPDIVFLCSPNNPTGIIDEPEAVSGIIDRVGQWGGLVVVDEAYGQFAPWSAVELVGDRNLVVTRTYSKTWAMAGARLGYLLGPAWLVAQLEKVVLPYHLDSVTQLAGTIALRYEEAMQERVAALVEQRGRVAEGLARLDVDQWPSGANFILFRPRARDAVVVWQQLLERGVLVRDCSSWPRLEGCLRVTIGMADENDRFLEGLRESLAPEETG